MENKEIFLSDIERCLQRINDKNTFNDWLGRNTKRNSFFTWEYNGKIYDGLDELRVIWTDEMDKYYDKLKEKQQ